MQVEYSNEKVSKILTDVKRLQIHVGIEIGRQIKKRLNQLEALDNFNQYLVELRFGKPHLLEDNLKGCFGISITGNYRLIVEPKSNKLDNISLKECKTIIVKGVVDYHGGKNEWIIP